MTGSAPRFIWTVDCFLEAMNKLLFWCSFIAISLTPVWGLADHGNDQSRVSPFTQFIPKRYSSFGRNNDQNGSCTEIDSFVRNLTGLNSNFDLTQTYSLCCKLQDWGKNQGSLCFCHCKNIDSGWSLCEGKSCKSLIAWWLSEYILTVLAQKRELSPTFWLCPYVLTTSGDIVLLQNPISSLVMKNVNFRAKQGNCHPLTITECLGDADVNHSVVEHLPVEVQTWNNEWQAKFFDDLVYLVFFSLLFQV